MPEHHVDPDDYVFRESAPTAAKTLTPAQVEFYNARGYLSPVRVGDEADVARWQAYFTHLTDLMRAGDENRNPYALLGYQARCAGMWDLIHHPRIVDVVEDLVGSDIVCWSTHFFNKVAGDTDPIPPHQDVTYWHLSPHASVTVWLAVDAVTLANGCMEVLPGTHRMGLLEERPTEGPYAMKGTTDSFDTSTAHAEQHGSFVPLELKPGEVSIHSDKTVHRSGPNLTVGPRRGFAMRFCAPSVRPTHPKWGSNAVLVRGEDRYGHFRLVHERPTGEDVAPWAEYLMARRTEERRRSGNPPT